jgi:hypothetical protein
LEQHEAKHLSQLRKAPITEYPRDSFVLVSCAPGALSRPATKLHFPRKGPYKVLNHNRPAYKIENLVTGKEYTVHVSRLKLFLYDPATTSPLDVARKDLDEVVVEQILEYRGNPKRKGDMEHSSMVRI